MKKIGRHDFLEKHYQFKLIKELTGVPYRTIEMYIRRHDVTVAQALIYYLEKHGVQEVQRRDRR